jgi:hypothetical protein
LRKDLLQKVKQYDNKLSNVLQTFQVSCPFITGVTLPTYHLQAQLGLDVRFAVAQLAEGRKVRALKLSSNRDRLTSPIGNSE